MGKMPMPGAKRSWAGRPCYGEEKPCGRGKLGIYYCRAGGIITQFGPVELAVFAFDAY